MYCLDKLQRELAYFLDIDLRDLPKVQEILKAQGYTAVKKNDEIIELGNGKISKEQVEKLKEVVESGGNKSKSANLKATQTFEVELHEAEQLQKHFNFKNKKPLLRELRENEIAHALKSHGDETKESQRGNIAITRADIEANYPRITQEYDEQFFTDKSVIYVKQINGYHIAIEEALLGQDKLIFKSLWKTKGNYNKEVLLKNAKANPYPHNADEVAKSESISNPSLEQGYPQQYHLSNTDSTTNNLKWQQDGNVLRSVVELDNGEKLLLSKDRLENVYIQSNFKEQINSYDELILQESLEKFAKDELENKLAKQIESISQFGENYPQFYHKPHEAIQHLLHTKSGQVQGAFYRDEIGDITLAWGEKGTGKSDGWGLAKIVEYHPEALDKLDELVQNLPIVKENANRYQLENDMYKLSIRKDFEGQKENWILTAFEKDESIARRRTDLPSSQSEAEKTTSANATDIIPQKRSKAGIAKLDSAQIQSQMQKEQEAQEAMAESMAQAQAKRDELIAQKEARLGKNADEVPLDKGQDILYKPIRDTSIVLNDETAPFEAEFAVVRLSDIKPNFDNSNTQGRLIKQESVIANIVNDFKPELMFYQEGGVNGVPIITRDGKVVSGNHRSEALKEIFNAQTHNAETAQQKYKQGAKEFLGVELENDEIIVRRLKENMSDKQILQLAFSSNIGRESTMGEKALSTLSLYRQNISTLPKALQSENVNELKSLVAKHIDKQGNGLNTFDTNLALLTSLARNGKNSNILQSLDSIKGNAEYKNKIINMYVDNAGSFYNLANNPSFKNLEFRDILSDSIFYTAKQNPTRELDYTHLIQDIESFLNIAKDKEALKNALVLDSNKVENLTAQAFGLALAKFSRQENPSSALYECLKEAPKALELATQPTFFTQGKALSEVDIYDFLEYLINQGQITQSQSQLSSLMPRLRELRESIANPQSSVLKAESIKENTYILREQTKEILNSLVGKNITNQNDGRIAQISRKNIAKMTSDKAIAKSVANGFSPQEHFKAVQEVDKLYQGAVFRETQKDTKNNDPALIIHRYEAELDNANGLITIKESLDKNKNRIYSIELEGLESKLSTKTHENKQSTLDSSVKDFDTSVDSNMSLNAKGIIPQNSTKAQSEYFNPFMNEYEKIKEIKKLHTQDDVLVRVMKINDRYIEPLSNMSVSKEYLQKQTAQSLKENITQAILGNQTQLKALQQGYNTYHLSDFQKEVLESALDIANNPTKLKEYKLQGLQKQLDNLNSNEAYHIEKGREYDKARYAKDREELEKEISALKGTESSLESAPQKVDSSLSQEIKDIIDSSPQKGRDMQIIGEANFTPQVVEYAHKNSKKVAIDKLEQTEAEQLGYKYPQDVRVTIDYQAINHTLNRHGAESALVKNSGQKAVDYTDIAEYRNIVKGADESLDSVDNSGNPVLVSYKQVNGHFVVVEQIKKKNNEIGFKTMFKENGDYKNSQSYKDTRAKAQTLSIGYEPSANSFAKADDIIPQQTLESTMQKFNYDERKAKDLLEWHKDSSPLTKDENGVPKVFYHGSETDKPFEVFLSEKDQTKWGFWFSSNADDADLYAMARGNQAGKHGYKVFLKAKNIFDFNDEKNLEVLKKIFSKEDYEFMLDDLQKWGKEINVFNMLRDTNFDRYRSKAEVFKNELKKIGYDGIKELGDTIVVFDSNQIKHIDNKGVDGKYFNESSPNIFHSNAHLGSGLVGGSVSGIESDENGNLTFSPEKFVLGFLGGSVASKAVSSGYKMAKARYYEKNFDKFIDDVNAKKSQMQPRFQVTQELEKSYRENEVKVSDGIAEKLGLKGKVFADYIKLAQKHPEYFANPQEAKALTEYIAQNAKIGIKASKKEYELVFAEIQGGKGVFAIDLEYKSGKHRIRSVYLMKNSQYKRKLYEAKKLGEPILHF